MSRYRFKIDFLLFFLIYTTIFIIILIEFSVQQFVAVPFPSLIQLPLLKILGPFQLLQSKDHDMKSTRKMCK